jgi:predicted membrane protein (TIGR00267 family)
MKPFRWFVRRKYRLDLVAGFCDGILTALALAAGKMLNPNASLSASLALRVAAAAGISGAFIFFVAHYAEERGELLEYERQLNLTTRGRLVKSRLGRAVLFESGVGALVASICSLCGALLPILVGVLAPAAPWLGIVAALAALAVLGVFLAMTVQGSRLRWAAGLLVSGGTLAYIGLHLRII